MKKAQLGSEFAPVKRERLTAQEFQRLVKESPHLIARSRFISPSIGRRDFGAFEVEYSIPMLRRHAA